MLPNDPHIDIELYVDGNGSAVAEVEMVALAKRRNQEVRRLLETVGWVREEPRRAGRFRYFIDLSSDRLLISANGDSLVFFWCEDSEASEAYGRTVVLAFGHRDEILTKRDIALERMLLMGLS